LIIAYLLVNPIIWQGERKCQGKHKPPRRRGRGGEKRKGLQVTFRKTRVSGSLLLRGFRRKALCWLAGGDGRSGQATCLRGSGREMPEASLPFDPLTAPVSD